MLRQLDLFARGAPGFDAGFGSLRRRALAYGAWIDHAPDWVRGHDALFDELARTLPWRREQMAMYDKIVDVPRLLARVAEHPLLDDMRRALSARYEEFVHVTAAM